MLRYNRMESELQRMAVILLESEYRTYFPGPVNSYNIFKAIRNVLERSSDYKYRQICKVARVAYPELKDVFELGRTVSIDKCNDTVTVLYNKMKVALAKMRLEEEKAVYKLSKGKLKQDIQQPVNESV